MKESRWSRCLISLSAFFNIVLGVYVAIFEYMKGITSFGIEFIFYFLAVLGFLVGLLLTFWEELK